MPTTGGRRGRRDNGLMASAYESVGDIDPRVGEHLLDVLGARGIAAYLQPSTDLHPITRTTSLPARPTDRLFVDREHVETARGFVRRVTAEQAAEQAVERGSGQAERGSGQPAAEPAEAGAETEETGTAQETPTAEPEVSEDPTHRRRDQSRRHQRRRTDPKPPGRAGDPGEPDVDSAWAAIVAGYHLTADPDVTPTLTLGEPRLLPRIDPNAEPRPRVDEPEPSLLDALDTFGATLPDVDEDDEGYTPPPAPPLPRISAAAALSVAAIVGGLLLFVWPDLLPLARNTVLVLAFGLIVAGFGTLIWRLRPGDDEDDDDFDDGARI
ncbi:DUF308 domain-containing protein [Virgisporangium aurantiacum]|uniref:DUF308 domain-containing protein n=1 Tax=Virgisporangium aurantiacum TaxID=175570 RepID=A0A8J4E4S5_9ACTN|nr:DUF308 domain-containing protein [Virgisporangium aurantiacum]GIJ61541.1 hypothetical protein Vau01_090570 [Virgisporangium aurantiacum]